MPAFVRYFVRVSLVCTRVRASAIISVPVCVRVGNGMEDAATMAMKEREIEVACRELEGEEWFHGVLPREEVQRLLVRDGDFLMRSSRNRKTNETQLVLSVMWNGHKHFILHGQPGTHATPFYSILSKILLPFFQKYYYISCKNITIPFLQKYYSLHP